MKKLTAITAAIAISAFPLTGFAHDDIKVVINDGEVGFDAPPRIIDGRTMVPMRGVFEALGAEVSWVEEARLILAVSGTSIIAMEIGSPVLTVTELVSGQTSPVELDVPPMIEEDRTFVPVRAVSEALNKNVEWDGESLTVTIN
ncbi:MAG: copper amine oxidase N-terminal domain-containing protein [Candidatus Ornithomonoglobus sp.]